MSEAATTPMIPLSVPEISGNEWIYVKECLDTGWVSSVGSFVERFEQTVAAYTGSRHAVAVVNGTSAIHISLIACGLMSGHEVIVPTLTFIAPVNTVKYCGAHPVFIDCDRDSLCIDLEKTETFLSRQCTRRKDGYTYNNQTGRRIKAIIPVHAFGHPTNMDHLIALSKDFNITVIEDATGSLGSEYDGKKTGSFGEAGCFSFNGNKIITTGGGGMVVTDNRALADRIRHLSTQAKKGVLEYDHDEIGYNYRLTNIQAAMGLAQMERLEEFITIKRRNAALYQRLLSKTDRIEFLRERPRAKSNCWMNTIRVPREHRGPLMDHLFKKNIQVRPVWKPIHELPMYQDAESFGIGEAAEVSETCINIPCSVGLKQEDLQQVAACITGYFEEI